MSTAVIFPGQGSQAVGMVAVWPSRSQRGREIWNSVDGILGRPLTKIISEGPKDMLDLTINAQPALFTVNYLHWETLRESGCRPDFFLGHSLGELSACAAAGMMSFETGLRLVGKRAELMAACAARNPGGMAAVLGLDAAETEKVAAVAGVEIANYNAPGQIVISGPLDKIEAAEVLLKSAGARKVVRLAVSGPFHSSLMAQAAGAFAQALQRVEFAAPSIPIVSNVTAMAVRDGDEEKGLLERQIKDPVRWTESVEFAVEKGVGRFIEAGPGAVLRGLIKRIAPEVDAVGDETFGNYADAG